MSQNPVDVLQDMLCGGWQGLEDFQEKFNQQQEADAERQREMAVSIARTFAGPDGQKTLEWLRDMTLRRGSWAGGLMLPMDVITGYGLFREGQNSIVHKIEQAIGLAQQKPVKPRGTDDG